MVNRRSFWTSCLVAVFGIVSLASAGNLSHNPRPAAPASHVSKPQGFCGPENVTESSTDTVTSLNSVNCNNGVGHTDNSYWRAFTLSDFGITNDFDICSVEIGVEEAASGAGQGGIQPITVNLYTSNAAFPSGFPGSLTLIGTADINVADQVLSLFNIPVIGTAPAGSQLVVEIFTPDGEAVGNFFFIGSNADPETNPSYLSAAACGITTPTTTAGIGFPNMHIVMHVFGTQVVAFTTVPFSLTVDPALAVGILGNGVLEMNELAAVVAPGWTNTGVDDFTMTGVASNFTGPNLGTGVIYTISDSAADYGTVVAGTSADCLTATGDCYTVDMAGTRTEQPVHMDATMDEDVTPVAIPFGQPHLVLKTWILHVGESFTDVSNDLVVDPFYPSIETVLHNSVTGGCGDGTVFCPTDPTTRAQMAVFLLKSFLGSSYVPPACASVFTDVPCPATVDFPFSDWVEDLYGRNITAGCQTVPTLMYCPDQDVLRSQMAVFLLKTSQGSGYVPPACASLFTDVPCPATVDFPYSDFIEDIYNRGITAGCQAQGDPLAYCPDNNVLRQEMAVFLTKTFSLVLYGP